MRPIGLILALALMGACSQAVTPPSPPAVPGVPEPAPGWQMKVAFGGSGPVSSGVTLSNGEPVALSVSCRGFGDLIVILGHTDNEDSGLRRAVTTPCSGSLDGIETRRFELGPLQADERVLSVSTLGEDAASARNAYQVSLEQPND